MGERMTWWSKVVNDRGRVPATPRDFRTVNISPRVSLGASPRDGITLALPPGDAGRLAPLRETSNHQDTEELLMKTVGVLVVSCALALVPAQYSEAQTAGSTTLGVAVEELKVVAVGWSVK